MPGMGAGPEVGAALFVTVSVPLGVLMAARWNVQK